jgi:hypothetical protein
MSTPSSTIYAPLRADRLTWIHVRAEAAPDSNLPLIDVAGARRPVSRVLSLDHTARWTAIPLGRLSPGASRDTPGWRRGKPARRSEPKPRRAEPTGLPSLLGLAPGGVCPASPVAAAAVRSYRTLSPLPSRLGPWPEPHRRRFAFCGTVPGVASAGRYPAPCFPWSPDFPLPATRPGAAVQPSGTDRDLRSPSPSVNHPAARICAIRWLVSSSRTPSTRIGRKWR